MIRYLVGFLGVCALLGTLPRSASAEADEEPVPSSETASEEPALQLGLTPAGVDIAPSSPRTDDGYTLEEMDVRVRRAKIGLGSSAAVLFAGGMFLGFGMSGDCGLEFCFGECTPPTKAMRRVCVDRHGSLGGRLRRNDSQRHPAAQAQA